MKIKAHYYQQFDADLNLDVPQDSYGGWQSAEIDLDPARSAIVLMHAWNCGTPGQYPGWYRCCPGILKTYEICENVLPPLLAAVRASSLPLFHVVGWAEYYQDYPGYQRAVELAGPPPEPPVGAEPDETLEELRRFREDNCFVGKHNREDVNRGASKIDFPKPAKPLGDEGIAKNAHQLTALARDAGVNHLIYCGFNIDWCLLMSAGGMLDMQRRGFMCSAIRDAVTAVESKESAPQEFAKQIGLWRVAINFGFVFDSADLICALHGE